MSKKTVKRKAVFSGALAGLINGFFGGGGGMVCVPMLIGGLNLTQKQAHATAIFFILPLSIASGIFYAVAGNFPLAGWWVTLGVVIGGGVGAILLSRISQKITAIVFTVIMALSGAYLLLF